MKKFFPSSFSFDIKRNLSHNSAAFSVRKIVKLDENGRLFLKLCFIQEITLVLLSPKACGPSLILLKKLIETFVSGELDTVNLKTHILSKIAHFIMNFQSLSSNTTFPHFLVIFAQSLKKHPNYR